MSARRRQPWPETKKALQKLLEEGGPFNVQAEHVAQALEVIAGLEALTAARANTGVSAWRAADAALTLLERAGYQP